MELVFIRENTSKELLFRIDNMGYLLPNDTFVEKADQGLEDGQSIEAVSHPICIFTCGLSFEHDLDTLGHSQLSYQWGNVIKDTQAWGFDFVRDSLPTGSKKRL